jgi:flagellar biosynthesis protein FlhG
MSRQARLTAKKHHSQWRSNSRLLMDKSRGDQAAGLRRLLKRDSTRVVAFVAGCHGAGGTTAVVNIAAALAADGRQVLAIDENGGAAGVTGLLGLHPPLDLRHAARRECTLDDVLVYSACGITVLPATHSGAAASGLRTVDRRRLLEDFARLGERFDIVLIDTRDGPHPGLLSGIAQDVVLVASASAAAVTGAYSLVKRSTPHREYKRFHILVNDVGIAAVAQRVFGNLQRAARDYLDLPLENLGWVPRDDALPTAAARRQSVIAAFPGAPSAIGFGRVAKALARWPHSGAQNQELGVIAPRVSSALRGLPHAN